MKNKSINGLKGFLAIIIVLLHFFGMYSSYNYFYTGYLAVEGFFIISGYFFYKAIIKREDKNFEVIKERIKKLLPAYYVSIFILILFYFILKDAKRFFSIKFLPLLAELTLLQNSGFFPFELVNLSWYVSALVLSMLVIYALYKLLEDKLIYIFPIIILVCYSFIYTSVGNLNVHGQQVSIYNLGLVRAIAGMSIGSLLTLINSKTKISQSISLLIELICIPMIIYLINGNTYCSNDFAFFIPFSLIFILQIKEQGILSKILNFKVFQIIGDNSYYIYLNQYISIFILIILFPDLNSHLIVSLLILFILITLFTYLTKFIINKSKNISFKRINITKIIKNNILEIIISIIIIIIFSFNRYNVWGEIVAEYLPYATSNVKLNSFAGYITLFPYIISKVYYYTNISNLNMSWVLFANIIANIYLILCTITIIKILKEKVEKKYILLLMIPVIALYIHPSVTCLINITHLGFIPIIIYIISCLMNKKEKELKNVPTLCYVCLVPAMISKPSMMFIPLTLSLLLTDLRKSKKNLIYIASCIVFTVLQSILYKTASSSLIIGGAINLYKTIIVFLQNIGLNFVFCTVFYKNNISYNQTLSILSIIIGVVFVILLIAFIIKKAKTKKQIIVNLMIIGSIVLAVILPYSMIDYTGPLKSILSNSYMLSMYKYKLQYQLTSVFILTTMLIFIISDIKRKKAKIFITFIFFMLFSNMILSSISTRRYLSSVLIGKNEIINLNNSPYLYAPYGEWNYDLISSSTGWSHGATVYKFYDKENINGGNFINKNEDFDNNLPTNYNEAITYIVVSDKNNLDSETNWIKSFFNKRKNNKIIIKGKNFEKEYKLSKQSIYGTSYAIIKYNKELVEKIYDEDTAILINEKNISKEKINVIVVYIQ